MDIYEFDRTPPRLPGVVWYNPDGIANILYLADAEKYFCVRYDSSHEKAFVVVLEKSDGTEQRRFVKTDQATVSSTLIRRQ
jgi:hypothetical protein